MLSIVRRKMEGGLLNLTTLRLWVDHKAKMSLACPRLRIRRLAGYDLILVLSVGWARACGSNWHQANVVHGVLSGAEMVLVRPFPQPDTSAGHYASQTHETLQKLQKLS